MSMSGQARPRYPSPSQYSHHQHTSSNHQSQPHHHHHNHHNPNQYDAHAQYPMGYGDYMSPPSPLAQIASHDPHQLGPSSSLNQGLQDDAVPHRLAHFYDGLTRSHDQVEWMQYAQGQQQQQHGQQVQQLYQASAPVASAPQSSQPNHHLLQQQQQLSYSSISPSQQGLLQQQWQQGVSNPSSASGSVATYHRGSLPSSSAHTQGEYYAQPDMHQTYLQQRASLAGPTAWLPANPFDPHSGSSDTAEMSTPNAQPQKQQKQPRKQSGAESSPKQASSPTRSSAQQSPGKSSKKRQRSTSREDQQNGATSSARPTGRRKSSDLRILDGPTTIFQCRGFGDCCMTFTRSEHLARHIRKHTGERPFCCHCGKAFSRLDNLRQHAQTVHSEEPERNESMMSELTNLHTHLAASAARDQVAQAFVTRITPVVDGIPVMKRQKSGKKAAVAKKSNAGDTSASNAVASSPTSSTFPTPSPVGLHPHQVVYGISAAAAAQPPFATRDGGMLVPHFATAADVTYGFDHYAGPGVSTVQAGRDKISDSSDTANWQTANVGSISVRQGVHHGHSHESNQNGSIIPPVPYSMLHYQDDLSIQQQQQLFMMAGEAALIDHRSPFAQAALPHSVPIADGLSSAMQHESARGSQQQRQQQQQQQQQGRLAAAGPPVNSSIQTTKASDSMYAPIAGLSEAVYRREQQQHSNGLVAAASFGNFFSTEQYPSTAYSSGGVIPSESQAKKASASGIGTIGAKMSGPLDPLQPPNSTAQGRPLTASGEPAILLPPLQTISRPTTSSAGGSAAISLSAATQQPATDPRLGSSVHSFERSQSTATTNGSAAAQPVTSASGVSWGINTVREGRSRPPTGSLDSAPSLRFNRRTSMLDLPEMALQRLSRPTTSTDTASNSLGHGHIRKPELSASTTFLPTPSTSGRVNTLNSFDGFTHHQVEKLRPFSSSGRLSSSSGLSALGDMFRTPSTTGYGAPQQPVPRADRWERGGSLSRKTSPHGRESLDINGAAAGNSSPFRFQPPPLVRDSGSSSPIGSGVLATTAAATFFKDRPLTTMTSSSSSRRERYNLASSTFDENFRPRHRREDVGSRKRAVSQRQHRDHFDRRPEEEGISSREFRRPCTAGDLPPLVPTFGRKSSSSTSTTMMAATADHNPTSAPTADRA